MADEKITNHEDLLVKMLAKDYSQEFLDYLESLYQENHKNPVLLPCGKIKSKSSTEIITPTFKNLFMDFAYEMEDGTILHYEHYSTNLTDKKLTHTGRYDFEKHEETGKQINTIIVSTGDPKKSISELWLGVLTNFKPYRVIFLKDYDGGERLKKIKKKIKNNKKLTFFEIIDLVLMAFFTNEKAPEEIVEEVCYLTTQLTNATSKERNLLRWGLTLVSNKFITNPVKLKQIKEVIKMENETIYESLHRHFEDEKQEKRQEGLQEGLQEGRQKGRQEGLQEGRQEGLHEGRQEGLQEGRQEERTSILNTMKTLENEGKTLSEAINILQSK